MQENKAKNCCVSALWTTVFILLGFFCYTLFWALFILFIGGGPISRHCADNSTSLLGLIACVQGDFTYGILTIFSE